MKFKTSIQLRCSLGSMSDGHDQLQTVCGPGRAGSLQLSASNKRYNSSVCLFMLPSKQKRAGLLTGLCVMKTVLHSYTKGRLRDNTPVYTVMRRITTFRSTTDRICDSGPIILYYIISSYHTISHHILYHIIMSYHITSHYNISHHIIPYHITLYYITSSYHTILHHIYNI